MVVITTCEHCGEEYEVYKSELDRSRFCSKKCKQDWESENNTGKNNPAWKGGKVEIECEQCGEKFKVNQYQEERGREFCSQECFFKYRSNNIKGEDHPLWEEGVELECEWCGDIFKVKKSIAENRRFCCERCYMDWLSDKYSGERWVGEDNPMYTDSENSHDRYYGRNWSSQRDKAKERDNYECQICNSTQDLEVHHKKPIINFDRSNDDWYEDANDLDNLITLCRSCHKKVHSDHAGEVV